MRQLINSADQDIQRGGETATGCASALNRSELRRFHIGPDDLTSYNSQATASHIHQPTGANRRYRGLIRAFGHSRCHIADKSWSGVLNEKDNSEQEASFERDHHDKVPTIVAVGASAGGVSALQSLFATIPPNTGAAFVVVVHLDPEHRSELATIIGARTRMPVVQITEQQRVEANHVYVIPPDRRLQMVDHQISSFKFDEPRGQRAPIDLFLRSLAERLGDGFAVILSGAGSDGTIGVRAVKEAGGIVLVQDPSEAEYNSMPRSAIATGIADFVLPVRDLGKRLVDLIRIKESAAPDIRNFDEELLRRIIAHLRGRTGHDFSKYKRSTVLRRIARRMQVTGADDLSEYHEIIRDQPEEIQALFADLLISVTTFFRDSQAFEIIARDILPEIFMEREADQAIRVWVSGCATGEEAYSFAILLLEEAARHGALPPMQVFGSDLDARALAAAREGRFPLAIEADVSEERLRRFFTREGEYYRVRQEVRDLVLFAVHDLLEDPPFSHVDLISCRNVLIYLDRDLQEQVIRTFSYALNPGGYIFVGASETADNPAGLFRCIDRTARIYQSTATVGEKPRLLPRLLGPVRVREPMMQVGRPMSPTVAPLEQMAPPSILIDDARVPPRMSDMQSERLERPRACSSMETINRYREFAEECERLAKEAKSERHRAILQKMAETWRTLAAEAEKKSAAAHKGPSRPQLN